MHMSVWRSCPVRSTWTGVQALMYVRSRHGDLRSDFGRSQRQQQVLLALRAKAKLLGIAEPARYRDRDGQ